MAYYKSLTFFSTASQFTLVFTFKVCFTYVKLKKKKTHLPVRGLSIPGLGIVSIRGVRGALVAVLVLSCPGLPGEARGHPVDGEPGHPLELNVLQGYDQEPGSGSRDGHEGGKNQDLSQNVLQLPQEIMFWHCASKYGNIEGEEEKMWS